MIPCKICNKEFENEGCLHKHIKTHDLLLAEYYQKTQPKYDRFDGSIIKFKNKEQYLNTDFNSRENLRCWIKSNDKTVVKTYIKSLLEIRITKKNLIWTPSQVELRSTLLPPIQTYNEYFGNYYSLCEELGLKNKFTNDALSHKFGDYTIFIDNREQLPLEFSKPTEWTTLKVGDYNCTINANCFIERKAAGDFAGTFSGGFERFGREMDRAVTLGAYIIVLVEESFNSCLNFKSSDSFYHKNTKITSEFVFHNVRELIQRYSNLQFLFVNGRVKAAKTVERIFESEGSYRNVDLQYLADTGKI